MPLPPDHAERMQRVHLAVDGTSVGDAFGERYFGPPGIMTGRIEARQLAPPPWTWTDDTAMSLSIRDVLEKHGEIDRDDLADAFARRFRADRMRGYGPKAQEILEAIYSGTRWELAAVMPYRDGSKGNGGAMRAAPVGAYFASEPDRIVEQAQFSAEVTHAHPDGQAGAIAVALAAAWACARQGELFDAVLAKLPDSETQKRCAIAAACPLTMPVWQVATRVGAGENVLAEDTVPFALWCASTFIDSYENALWKTVSALGDRDTTCAIVGGIVALRVGRAGIPSAWLAAREPLS